MILSSFPVLLLILFTSLLIIICNHFPNMILSLPPVLTKVFILKFNTSSTLTLGIQDLETFSNTFPLNGPQFFSLLCYNFLCLVIFSHMNIYQK